MFYTHLTFFLTWNISQEEDAGSNLWGWSKRTGLWQGLSLLSSNKSAGAFSNFMSLRRKTEAGGRDQPAKASWCYNWTSYILRLDSITIYVYREEEADT